MRKGVIYLLFDEASPEDIRYVGKTVESAKTRLWKHIS